MEVRLGGCLTTCHPEWLLRNANSLVMPTLVLLPEESRNYHVLRASILSSQIFRIYDNYSAVWLFLVIVIVISLFMINFAVILAKQKDKKLKYRQKFCYFVIL